MVAIAVSVFSGRRVSTFPPTRPYYGSRRRPERVLFSPHTTCEKIWLILVPDRPEDQGLRVCKLRPGFDESPLYGMMFDIDITVQSPYDSRDIRTQHLQEPERNN
jgi:hypothetical protein